jgi:DNA polymerase-3 subunit epsilon
MKILWIDVETTGINPWVNDIHQLAGIIEIDGQIKEEFDIKCQPFNWNDISNEALELGNLTIETLRSHQPPKQAHKQLCGILGKYIDKFDKTDKAYIGAYNGTFDTAFLASFFQKCGDKYYGSWTNHRLLDPLPIVRMLEYQGICQIEKHDLATVCQHFGIELDQAHNALSDIRATRALWVLLADRYIVK